MPTAAHRFAVFAACAAFAAAGPLASAHAAETYPSKPIRIIVTGTPGGPPDILTRWLADRLGPALGSTVVVLTQAGVRPLAPTDEPTPVRMGQPLLQRGDIA